MTQTVEISPHATRVVARDLRTVARAIGDGTGGNDVGEVVLPLAGSLRLLLDAEAQVSRHLSHEVDRLARRIEMMADDAVAADR